MQDQYLYAWGFYFFASLLLLVVAWYLAALLYFEWLQELFVITLMVVIWSPAPVPDYSGSYAPAVVVAGFEAFLQSPGQPDTAILILQSAVAVCWLLFAIFRLHMVTWFINLFRARDPFDHF